MLGTLAIVISLLLLMFLAYRGITVLLLAPLMAALAVLLSGEISHFLPIYTGTFMSALANYVLQFLPIFLLGALFGQLMADSGAAMTLSRWIMARLGPRHAILTVAMATGLLTYGGVSVFVVAFAIYPIARSLFREADIPKRLLPPAIALGAFTCTMTAMPGTPSVHNAIPIPFFGTNVFAAPGLGIIASVIMIGGGLMWLWSRQAKARAAGEGYGHHPFDAADENHGDTGRYSQMPVLLALLPLILVVAVNALFTYAVFPGMDFSALTERFPKVNPAKSTGLWALIIALVVACTALVLMRWNHWTNLKETINKGTLGFMLPLFNTASEVGYGAVIASMAGFAIIRDAVLNVSDNPLISEAFAMNVIAGITGSASGGMSIALQTLGSDYLALAQQAGISPELLHRVAVIAAGCLDSLPHNGAVITLLAICGLTHRQSYLNIAMLTIAIPLLSLAVVIALGTAFGSF
ncbi:MAG: GntP family permease [Comamonadaceae bacterium]|nr:GntP family permease [Comamonadaceae bacterium]